MKKFAWLFLLPLYAHAQTFTGVPSMWSPATWAQTTVTGQVQLLDATGAVLNVAPVGQIGMLQTQVTATFPAQPSAVSAATLQIGLIETGAGWSGAWTASFPLPAPVPIPAGGVTTLTYNTNPLTASLVFAVAVPVVVPPVVVPPVVVPPAFPGDGTIPPSASLTDVTIINGVKTSAIWTLLPNGHPLRNGAETGGSGVVIVQVKLGITYAKQTSGQWWKWNGGGWGQIAAAP